jgi:hypothetical protein
MLLEPEIQPGNVLLSTIPASVGLQVAPLTRKKTWILLQDGPHVLTMNVDVSNQQKIWFDHLQYKLKLDHWGSA